MDALPLDWTRVQRRNRKDDAITNNKCDPDTNMDDNDDCCKDPTKCPRRRRFMSRPRKESSSASASASSSSSLVSTMVGHAIFCLHDTNPSWFQGYFIPHGSSKPWGLLAVQEVIDDCLECADGGYRRVSLSIYHPSKSTASIASSSSRKPHKVQEVDWTGGDMMRLEHDTLVMETDRLYTGKTCISYLNQYFGGFIAKLRTQCEVDNDTPILEWLPDVAVILGTMSITMELPKINTTSITTNNNDNLSSSHEKQEAQKNDYGDDDDDDF